jgi:2-polyprenyl-6-methoxyphenol hydroxylase-like FAD-dependent oxidoreductase
MSGLVLVVGAGPVGLMMAMALQRRGVDVRIIDKAAARTDKSKALVLWPRTLELLDIHGCVQPFLDAGMKGRGARVFADGKELVHVSLDIARSVYRYALMIPQSETECVLEAQLTRLGVVVERQVELTSFVATDVCVTAVLRHSDGREETVTTAYLAACDGAHSTVRHGLAARFDGETLPSDWMLADVSLDGAIPADEITICWKADGVLALFPIIGARFRIIADTGRRSTGLGSTGDSTPPTLQMVQAALDSRGPPGLTARDPIWLSHFRINERKVQDYSYGRVFLAGDAAHVHSPAGGQGMNTGMQDAFNLAWKLAMVWHGQASPALLDSYSIERGAIGEQVLRNAGRMTQVATLRNPVLQKIRNLIAGVLGHVPALRQRFVDQLTEVDLHYADNTLSLATEGGARHPAVGARAPDLPLAAGEHAGSRLHDLLATGKFAVLSVAAPAREVPDSLRSIATAARANAHPDYASGHIFLIRPDAYVAMSTDSDGIAAIITALQRIVGGA